MPHTYLLVNSAGVVYVGATINLRKRLREHRSVNNKGYTREDTWYLLGARYWPTKTEAFAFEYQIKHSYGDKIVWKFQCLERGRKLEQRLGISLGLDKWKLARNNPARKLNIRNIEQIIPKLNKVFVDKVDF